MGRSGLISGAVVDGAGRPVAGARVYFASGPGSFPDVAALTGGEGRFSLSAPMAGTYEVQVQADGFVPETVAVRLRVGERSTIRIRLREARRQ